jgi:hypothetical protein
LAALRLGSLIWLTLLAAACADPVLLTATVETSASSNVVIGGSAQLLVKVTNTGPAVPHLGLVFRTADRWYERHRMTDLSGCSIAADASAFDCGDLKAKDSKTFSFLGVATTAGSFHYELALRELVRPFDYVNDHRDGVDVQTWDETVTP